MQVAHEALRPDAENGRKIASRVPVGPLSLEAA
jgi:hypothetical protein